jgi:hypothetical protein
MKDAKTATLSGCLVWAIVFGMLSCCFLPAGMSLGGVTSASNFAMQSLGPILCSQGATAESYSYPTTTTDEYGNIQPSTAYELHCIDAAGQVVKEDPVLYAFLWMGIIAVIGLVIAALFAFILAAPAGILIARLVDGRQKRDNTVSLEPD